MRFFKRSFSSVSQSYPTLCDPMNCSMPDFTVHHQLPKFAQTHVHRVGNAIQPSHPLLSSSPHALNLSQHQGLFQWVSSSHQVAKILEFQHQSFQWIIRVCFPLGLTGLFSLLSKGLSRDFQFMEKINSGLKALIAKGDRVRFTVSNNMRCKSLNFYSKS